MTIELLVPYLLIASTGIVGVWVGVYSLLRVHGWRLNEQKELLISHEKMHRSHEARLTRLEISSK